MKRNKLLFSIICIFILLLPFFTPLNSIYFSKTLSDDCTLNSRIIVFTDATGDVTWNTNGTPASHDPVDITTVDEDNSMTRVDVAFVGTPASGSTASSVYAYNLYIDTDYDNNSDYRVLLIEMYEVLQATIWYLGEPGTHYWNGHDWQTSTYADPSYAYIVGNTVVFDFSNCTEIGGNNWYRVYSTYGFTERYEDETGSAHFKGLSKPTAIIESPLNQTYYNNTIPVNLSSPSADLDSLWYRVRNATGWLTSNVTWSEGAELILPEGVYTLFAWANNSQGFESAPTNVTFTINHTAPSLEPISPNPNYNGIIDLDWDDLAGATWYYVYRNTSLITSVDNLIPIATTSTSNYTDTIIIDGTYYYVIIAGNIASNSSLSNIEEVNITITPRNEPISINSNSDFEIYITSGNGSEGNPYLIENYVIDLFLQFVDGILIQNTTAHFILRNCTVFNGESTIMTGIKLENVTNAQIINNSIIDNYQGIHLVRSDKNVLINNTAFNNMFNAIYLTESSNNTIIETTAYNNSRGIYLSQASTNNTLSYNTIYDNGNDEIRVENSNNNTLSFNVANNNYWYDGICLISSSNNTLLNNTAEYNRNGILLDSSNNNTLINNTLSHNNAGIDLDNSSENLLKFNTAFNNAQGITFSLGASENTLINNTITTNNFGIYLISNSNASKNDFFNNTVIYSTQMGISFGPSSNNCTLINNTLTQNRIGIDMQSNDNTLINNVISNDTVSGIYFISASNNKLYKNKFFNTGISLFGSTLAHFIHEIPTDNVIDNRPIYYYLNRKAETIPLGAGQIIIVNSSLITISDYNLTSCSVGISLYYTNHTIVTNNMIANATGIRLYQSKNNVIYNNTILNHESGSGIYLQESTWNNLTKNVVKNTYTGIGLSTSSNNNWVINNTVAYCHYNGIYIYQSNDNTLLNNTANHNENYGFRLYYQSNNNTLIDNIAYNNSKGFFLDRQSNNNTLIHNTAWNNLNGISLDRESNNNTFTQNIANNNSQGFYLLSSNNNTISLSTINNNSITGIYLERSNYSIITWNTLYGNLFAINETNCIGNIIENNNFGLIAPVLYPILPNPDSDGIVELNWTDVANATTYFVYRYTSFIASVNGLVPITIITTSNYTDRLNTSGIYFYVIVAGNAAGNSSISNCINVTVRISDGGPPDGIDPFLILAIFLVIGIIAVSSITIYLYRRKKEFSYLISPPKEFKNLALNEKIRQIITQNISIEQFHKLNAPDLMHLLESEILIINPDLQKRLLNLPISDEDKHKILQELAKLPSQLQQKLLEDLENSFTNDTTESG